MTILRVPWDNATADITVVEWKAKAADPVLQGVIDSLKHSMLPPLVNVEYQYARELAARLDGVIVSSTAKYDPNAGDVAPPRPQPKNPFGNALVRHGGSKPRFVQPRRRQ